MYSENFLTIKSNTEIRPQEFYRSDITLTFAAKMSSLQRTQRSGPWRRCPCPGSGGGGRGRRGETRGDGGSARPWLRMARDLAVAVTVGAATAVGAEEEEANEGWYGAAAFVVRLVVVGGGCGGGAGNLSAAAWQARL